MSAVELPAPTNVEAEGDLQSGPENDPLTVGREAANEHTTAVYKLVLTGGPCAGKTTALSRMGDFFREKG